MPLPPPLPNGAHVGTRQPPQPAPASGAPAGPRPANPPPLPRRPSTQPPPADLSRLPPAIRASLARLAGEIAEEQPPSSPPDPSGPAKPGGG
jgi:hypothetical protein